MKVRILSLLVALLLPSLVLAEGWYGKQDKQSEMGRAPFSIEQVPVLDNVNFAFDRATVKPKYLSILDQAYESLQKDPHLRVSIQGHTDTIGSNRYNMSLSKKRANAVKMYFNDRGVFSHRLETAWHGESIPVASNATGFGRAENRRCTLTLFKRDISKDLPEDLGLIE